MRTLDEIIDSFKVRQHRSANNDNPFELACRLELGATRDEIAAAQPRAARHAELLTLWSASREAWLFEDAEYGQWGFHLLSPEESSLRTATERAIRPSDFRPDDIVLGEFLGDSELLVFAPSEVAEGQYLVALPLDPRGDWFVAGASAAQVFERYLASGGEKFWEQGSP